MRPMWLTRAKLPALASSIVKSLVDDKLIETESPQGVQNDMLAVLEQYLKDEHDISTRARDLAAARGAPATEVNRLRKELAKQQGVGVGEESIDYVLAQLVEMLLHSGSVDEIYGQEKAGKRFTPKQADLLGGQAQQRANAIAGQISQVAGVLGIELQA